MDPITPEEQARIDALLRFWFGSTDPAAPIGFNMALWFQKSPETDRRIRETFGADLERASKGGCASWEQSVDGTLALIILLDQLSRNIHRDSPQAFAADPLAQGIALRAVARGTDQRVGPVQRGFLYLPFEHAEDPLLQEASIFQFERLAREAPPELAQAMGGYVRYAHQHKVIIDRFGRYPHRNRILGRASTEEELTFLEQPGSSF